MSLKASYTLLAPFYDLFVGPAFRAARRASLAALPRDGRRAMLLTGVGSGLDLPFLPHNHRYVGLDLTRAMLARCVRRAAGHEFEPVQGNSLALPFKDASFDDAVMHLILAVVPDAAQALAETARVVRRGGAILILDKFLQRGQSAPLRRLLHPLAARLVTRLDVVFEEVLPRVPGLRVVRDEPAAAPAAGSGGSSSSGRNDQGGPGLSVPPSRPSRGVRRGQVHHTMKTSSASATPASSSSKRKPSIADYGE